jgi:hypothetical protein
MQEYIDPETGEWVRGYDVGKAIGLEPITRLEPAEFFEQPSEPVEEPVSQPVARGFIPEVESGAREKFSLLGMVREEQPARGFGTALWGAFEKALARVGPKLAAKDEQGEKINWEREIGRLAEKTGKYLYESPPTGRGVLEDMVNELMNLARQLEGVVKKYPGKAIACGSVVVSTIVLLWPDETVEISGGSGGVRFRFREKWHMRGPWLGVEAWGGFGLSIGEDARFRVDWRIQWPGRFIEEFGIGLKLRW